MGACSGAATGAAAPGSGAPGAALFGGSGAMARFGCGGGVRTAATAPDGRSATIRSRPTPGKASAFGWAHPHPGHPNAPGPSKRPLHNMCPTVVVHHGKPVMAVGGAGGVRIPNALYKVVSEYVLRGATMEAAIAAPRLFCTGTMDVTAEHWWPAAEADYLKQLGFKVRPEPAEDSHISAASFYPNTGQCRAVMR